MKPIGHAIAWALCGALIVSIAWYISLRDYTLLPNSLFTRSAPSHPDPVQLEVSSEGWIIIHGANTEQLALFCPSDVPSEIQGCASWKGPLFLKQPSPVCLILLSQHLTKKEKGTVLEYEKRHCREGAYHDQDGVVIPQEVRDALFPYNIPGVTR